MARWKKYDIIEAGSEKMINENKKEELKQMVIEEFAKRVNEYM